jgi:hypothetical protein
MMIGVKTNKSRHMTIDHLYFNVFLLNIDTKDAILVAQGN